MNWRTDFRSFGNFGSLGHRFPSANLNVLDRMLREALNPECT